MNMIENFLNSDLIYALGWTLIHSIWQIIFIGLTLKVLLYIFKNHSSNLKYSLSVSAFYLLLIVSIITFVSYFNFDNSLQYSGYNLISTEFSEVQGNKSDQASYSNISNSFSISSVRIFISSNIQYIVGLWLAGLFIFYFRLAGSFWYMQRLKSRNLFPLNNDWDIKINDLAQKLQINKIIRIAQSTTIQIPMVVGHLKPIIILPIGLLSSLPYNQVEAIFLHELAHIKRSDYLVNLIKSVVEVIFFYHPVLWWISSKIDDEREHCCDDLTIKVSNKKSALQDALLNIQKLKINTNKPSYIAAALFKNKHQLFKRIKRMKTQNFSKQSKFNGFTAIFILLISLLILATFSAFSPSLSDLPVEYIESDNNGGIVHSNPGNSTQDLKNTSEDLIIDLVTPDSTNKVKKDIDKDVDKDIDGPTDTDKDEEEKELLKEIERAQIQMEMARKEYDKAITEYQNAISESIDLEQLEDWTLVEKEIAEAMELAEIQWDNFDIQIPDLEEIEEQMEQFNLQLEEIELVEQLELMDAEMVKELQQIEKELAEQLKDLEEIKNFEFQSQELETKLRDELLKDGYLDDKDDELSFVLSKSSLEINGKLVSSENHQKYLNLYEAITEDKLEGTTRVIIQD